MAPLDLQIPSVVTIVLKIFTLNMQTVILLANVSALTLGVMVVRIVIFAIIHILKGVVAILDNFFIARMRAGADVTIRKEERDA